MDYSEFSKQKLWDSPLANGSDRSSLQALENIFAIVNIARESKAVAALWLSNYPNVSTVYWNTICEDLFDASRLF